MSKKLAPLLIFVMLLCGCVPVESKPVHTAATARYALTTAVQTVAPTPAKPLRNRDLSAKYLSLLEEDTLFIVDFDPNPPKGVDGLTLDKDGTRFLITPVYASSRIRVEKIDYSAAGFTANEALLDHTMGNAYSLLLTAIVPEGVPAARVVVEYEGRSAIFLISYNGSGKPRRIDGVVVLEE